jgi:hypothetical protein
MGLAPSRFAAIQGLVLESAPFSGSASLVFTMSSYVNSAENIFRRARAL